MFIALPYRAPMRSTCYLLLDPWPPFCIRVPETPPLNCRAGFSFRARRKSAPQSLLSLSFTLHDRTTRATGSTMSHSRLGPAAQTSPFTMSVVRGQAGPSHHSFRFYVSREIVACDTS